MTAAARGRTEPIVSARGIVNRFGRQQVHDGIDLDIRSGEVLGIAGGSGSGKSVLLRTLCGLHHPTAGKVLIEGTPVEDLEPAQKASRFGVLFQQGALFSSLSAAQNVMLPLREYTSLPPAAQERIASMKLELAGLKIEDAHKMPAELSGGMVKRAALARALALDPHVLFLDEPTSGLDALTAGGIDELILRLNQGLGVTVVIVTHDLTTLFTVCDRVAVLVDGRVTVNTVAQLQRASDPWVRELLHGPRARGALSARKDTRASNGN